MPATTLPVPSAEQEHLAQLGARLRAARKRQRVPSVGAAAAAGISRVTLHRIERGEPTVAMGAWAAVAGVLGLSLDVVDAKSAYEPIKLPKKIKLGRYPELKKLAWQLPGVESLSPEQALQLYERNWRHLDRDALTQHEADLIDALSREIGGGRLLV